MRGVSFLSDVELVDHHCHGVVRRDLDLADLSALLTEGGTATSAAGSALDSRIGLALRRWCPPVLDLPAHASPGDYLQRRTELGWAEVTRRLLRAGEATAYVMDTGFEPEPLTPPAEIADLSGARALEVVRLERLAEEAVLSGATAAGFADEVRRLLWERSRHAVAMKSIAAYRVGLELDPERPAPEEVSAAAGRWLAAIDDGAAIRCADEVVIRFLIWEAIDRGLPLQVHAGLGDSDVELHRCDPLLLTGLLRATEPLGVPILLLHNYPYHRQAGYLTQVFGHVYADVGLALHNVGSAARQVLGELLELAPFGKVLFSTDAYGLPELYLLGTTLFRRALGGLLDDGIAAGEWTAADAERVAGLIGHGNARRAYPLDGA